MIDIYIQYSYGGFKTFHIKGEENESVNVEVNLNNAHGFPEDANCYFLYGGAKILYRYLNNGKLDLIVREIPSIHKDGDGRSIPCAVQFIGDANDRQTMDYMATDIANNIISFHEFFSLLFRVRNGLRIDGVKLREWIDSHYVNFSYEGSVNQIKNIPNIKSGVMLFVPLSNNYGIDDTVTKNVSSELNLPFEQMQKDNCFISNANISKHQEQNIALGKAPEKNEPIEKKQEEKKQEEKHENNNKTTEQLELEIKKLKSQNTKLSEKANTNFSIIKKKEKEIEELKENIKVLSDSLSKNKMYLYISIAITVILAIYSLYSLFSN